MQARSKQAEGGITCASVPEWMMRMFERERGKKFVL
jgi:hypothetical protein